MAVLPDGPLQAPAGRGRQRAGQRGLQNTLLVQDLQHFAVEPQGDPLSGERPADQDLVTSQADVADRVDGPIHLHRPLRVLAWAGIVRPGPSRSGASADQQSLEVAAGQLRGQRLVPASADEDVKRGGAGA